MISSSSTTVWISDFYNSYSHQRVCGNILVSPWLSVCLNEVVGIYWCRHDWLSVRLPACLSICQWMWFLNYNSLSFWHTNRGSKGQRSQSNSDHELCTISTHNKYLRNECLFFLVHGEWIVARDKQIAWTAKRFSDDLFVPRYDSFPHEHRKNRHSFLIFTMFPTSTLSKILREKL